LALATLFESFYPCLSNVIQEQMMLATFDRQVECTRNLMSIFFAC